jgi:hypothetical protein
LKISKQLDQKCLSKQLHQKCAFSDRIGASALTRKQKSTSPLGHITPMPLRVPYHRVAGLIAKGNSKISLCASGAGKPERLISGFFSDLGFNV